MYLCYELIISEGRRVKIFPTPEGLHYCTVHKSSKRNALGNKVPNNDTYFGASMCHTSFVEDTGACEDDYNDLDSDREEFSMSKLINRGCDSDLDSSNDDSDVKDDGDEDEEVGIPNLINRGNPSDSDSINND